MEGQARSALLVARSARIQQVSPSKILFHAGSADNEELLWCPEIGSQSTLFCGLVLTPSQKAPCSN